MRFAVIGDIHSNYYALESVLNHIDTQNVDFILSTGDLVGYLPFPNEVISLIRKHKVLAIQGNHDEAISQAPAVSTQELTNYTLDEIQAKASRLFTRWCLTEENHSFLKNLPTKLTLTCHGLRLCVVHGSPFKINEYLYEDLTHLGELAPQIEEDIIICGHTHIPYSAKVADKYFINAGSVGKPKNSGGLSTYVIIDITDEGVKTHIQEVSYPVDPLIVAIRDNDMISDSLIPLLRPETTCN